MKDNGAKKTKPLPRMTVGRVAIVRCGDGRLWLQHAEGEGGHFDEGKLARVLERFFWRKF